MINRRKFIASTFLIPAFLPNFRNSVFVFGQSNNFQTEPVESDFSKRLKPIGRILEEEGFYVWCNSPIYDENGKVHVFYSRWPEKFGMGGWIHQCEIAHAVADSAESQFKNVGIVLSPREGFFDATTCHNPHIQKIGDLYCLFYLGNSNGKTNTKRIGLATSKSLEGPWERSDKPILEVGVPGSWDDHCTTNPAFLNHPNGEYWLYYKSWNTKEYEDAAGQAIRGNRQYGLAVADTVNGPYKKYKNNPVIDFSYLGNNEQLEDAYVWFENGKFKLIARDMGFFNHNYGLIFESEDGLNWEKPQIAYYETEHYFEQPPAPKHLTRYGRLERPQLLMRNNKPEYLFTTTQGGKYNTASAYVFKIENN
jgi:hypothetical protein